MTPTPSSNSPASEIRRAAVPAATLALAFSGSLHAEMAAEGTTVELPKLTVEEQRRAVSSPKFTVPLVDTPQTISVITSDVFGSQGATNLSEVLRNTPGITFAAGEGGNVAAGDSFFMRGFDASGSIFIDGVRDTGAYNRDTYNLEQVEIAKGPAGADTGRGGSSGYINLSTKVPHIKTDTSGQVIYGGAADGEPVQRTTLDLNRPLNAKTAFRVAALWQDSGVPGRDNITNKSWGISPSLALGLGTDTQFTLAATIDRLDNLPDSGLPIAALPGVNLPGGSPAVVDQANTYGMRGQDYDKVDRTSLTARLAHDFSGSFRLVNQTKWIDTDRDSVSSYFQNSATTPVTFAPATTPVNPATGTTPPSYVNYDPVAGTVTPRRLHTETANEIISNQTNLATQFETGRVYHSASAGLELSREEQFVPAWSPVGGVTTSITNPDPNRVATAAQTPYLAANRPYAKARIDTAAIYAFDTIQLSPRFLVNASLRWETYDIDFESLAAATATTPAPTPVVIATRDDIFSWKTGLVFKPAANGSLYFAVANTLTPPGSSFTLSATAGNQNNPNVDPLESRNYELGAKWEFLKGRLSTNLALYRSENFNFTSTDAVTGLPTQDISQIVQGVEFGLSGKLTKDWLVFGGIGWIDSEYQAAGTTSSANDGAALRFTPRLSGNLWTTYAVAKKLTIGGGLQYTDSVLRSTSNTQAPTATAITSIPDYWLVNLMAAYALNNHLTLRLNLNNVTDEFSYRLNNNGGRYYPGTPRSFLLTADWKF
jgi:catecholate siderophore receptor